MTPNNYNPRVGESSPSAATSDIRRLAASSRAKVAFPQRLTTGACPHPVPPSGSTSGDSSCAAPRSLCNPLCNRFRTGAGEGGRLGQDADGFGAVAHPDVRVNPHRQVDVAVPRSSWATFGATPALPRFG